MQISSVTGVDYPSLLKQLQSSSQSTPADPTGQDATQSLLGTANGAGSTQGPPPPPPPDTGSSRFSPDTLGRLVSLQSTSTSAISAGGSTSGDVEQALTALQQSLGQLETALGARASAKGAAATSSGTTTASNPAATLGQVLASLDADGDGRLSQAELTAGLDKLEASTGASAGSASGSTSQPRASQSTQATHAHHHHHHAAYAAAADSADATATSSATSSSASTATGSTVNLAA